LLVLIDGRSVYTPLFGGVYWQTQDTQIEDIERIEVIRGPGGTIWGANAVNGVINVITRNSQQTVGTLVTVGGGNVDQGRVGFRFGASAGDSLHYRVYGTGFSRGPLHHPGGQDYDDWRIAQTGFRADTAWRGGEVSVQGDLYKGSAGERVMLSSFTPPGRNILEGSDRVAGGNLRARWQHDTPGGRGLRVQAYYDRTDRSAVHFGEVRDTVDVDVLHHFPLGRRHHLSWGVGARRSAADFVQKHQTLTFDRPRRVNQVASIFAQDEIMLAADRLWLTLGSKFEYNNDSGLEIQPSARALWRLDATQSLWLGATRAVRTPSLIDTDLRLTGFGQAAPPIYLRVAGNPDFDAERLHGFEAGYRRLVGSHLFVDVAAFHNEHDDLAGFGPFTLTVPMTPIPHILLGVRYENAIRGSSDGIEISPDWRPTNWLQFKAAYALLATDFEPRPGYADQASATNFEGSSPRHQGYLRVAVSLPRGVSLDVTHRGASRLRTGAVPAYATADARLEWTLAPGVALALAGANLWQDHHVEFVQSDVPRVGVPRSVYASLVWRR
jgi:iron complex outermembrane recepter protein